MALARVQYESDGSTTVYSIPFPYINRDDIAVSIDGVETEAFSFLDGSTVSLDSAPPLGLIIDVIRRTERSNLLVEFNDGSTLLESDLTLAAKQSFFIAQEAFDQTGATLSVADDGSYSASTRRISLLGYPTLAEDAANKQYVDNIFAQGEDAYEQASIATDAANTAIGARDVTTLARDTTLNYRNTAEQHKIAAADSASAASSSETNANNSAVAAKASEDDVAANAAAAQTAESNALSYKNTAQTAAGQAQSYSQSANNSMVSADNDAAAASNSAANAATSETNSQSYRDQAQSFAGQASNSASNAAASEGNAQNSEQLAADHRTEARNWANAAEDTLVPEGDGVDDYSALHWSRKAEGWAQGVNMPSATGNGGKQLQQKSDETGFEYVSSYQEFGLDVPVELPIETNWNSVTNQGVYISSDADRDSNTPWGGPYQSILRVLRSGPVIHQEALKGDNKGTYISHRLSTNGGTSWSSWSNLFNSSSAGAGSGINADTLQGIPLENISTGTPFEYGFIPHVGSSDGVMEVGQYIDFHIRGNIADYSPRLQAYSDGGLRCSGYFRATSITETSDRRIKEDITDISGASGKVRALKGQEYYNTEQERKVFGLIAQDVLEIVPESVWYNDEDDRYSLNYTTFIPLLIEAVKELQDKVHSLEEQLQHGET